MKRSLQLTRCLAGATILVLASCITNFAPQSALAAATATLAQGEELLNKKLYSKAANAYHSYIQKHEKDYKGYQGRSKAYLGLFRFRESVDDLTKAINLNPKVPDLYAERANAWIRWGEFEKAIRDLGAALKNGAKDKRDIYIARAHSYRMISLDKDAVNDLTEALKIKEDPETYLTRADENFKTRAYKEAGEDYSKALNGASADRFAILIQRGACYEKTKRVQDAIADYTTMIEMKPDHYRGYRLRASALLDQGDPKKALEDINKSMKLYRGGNWKKLFALRALIYKKLGQANLAAKDYAQTSTAKKKRKK